jgi:DNA-binding CsgD family transcriptional regulator
VPALARGDSERLLRFVAEAESFGGDHPFEGEFLTQVGRLVPADYVGYSDRVGCDEGDGPHFDRLGDEAFYSGIDWDELTPVYDAEDPIALHMRQGGFGAVKISDFLTRRTLHRTRLYNVMLKPYDLEDSLVLRLHLPPRGILRVFGFDRGGRGFSARDRAVLELLHPHLVRLRQASESRRRLHEALALHESTRTAVVLLEADDRVAFASTAARELLDRYLGENGIGLPDRVASWLRERRQGATGEPLRAGAGGRELVVELVDGALLLEEQRRLPRLTAREREILDLVAEGRTNAEIAERLWISPETVRKHLENVYAKLGVHTRTAAAAFFRGDGSSFLTSANGGLG